MIFENDLISASLAVASLCMHWRQMRPDHRLPTTNFDIGLNTNLTQRLARPDYRPPTTDY